MTLGDKTMQRVVVSIPTLCSEKKKCLFFVVVVVVVVLLNC